MILTSLLITGVWISLLIQPDYRLLNFGFRAEERVAVERRAPPMAHKPKNSHRRFRRFIEDFEISSIIEKVGLSLLGSSLALLYRVLFQESSYVS